MIHVIFVILVALSSLSGFRLTKSNNRNGTTWVVLVAGSNGWGNYRHQANVCHAYHIVKSHGISEDHIITFMYDDIANHPENPFKGKIFNDYEHVDYYEGVKIDYREDDVNPETFMNALLGSPKLKKQGKKVLESGPEDEVFIYFTDHGGQYVICFPEDDLHASDLNKTLVKMHEKHIYKNLVFYLEACDSGSMFEHILPSDINVFAVTSTNSEEVGWACFCQDEFISACLSDDYSYSWMHDTDTHKTNNRTLQEQYQKAKEQTITSHVQEYGDMNLSSLLIGEFQGETSDTEILNSYKPLGKPDLVSSRHVQIHTLRKQLQMNQDFENQQFLTRRLNRAIRLNEMAIETIEDIEQRVRKVSPSVPIQSIHDWLHCYESVQKKYRNICFRIQKVPAVGKVMPRLVKLCQDGYEKRTIQDAIILTCE